MSNFPEVLPHGPIQQLFADVFVVTGSFRIGPGIVIPRNMIVVREGTALTLINSVRLDAAGERALEALGEPKHLVKLGFYHTRDDGYVRSRWPLTYWAPSPPDAKTERLAEGGASPLSRAKPFVFGRTADREAALVLEQSDGNLLITCDAVQNWVDTKGCSLMGKLVSRAMGFIQPAKIGPIWVKTMTKGHPSEMRADFDRLLQHDFAHLIAGHGVLLRDGAKEALRRSCDRALIG